MFDRLYKEANDEIPLNTVLMEQLKAEASRGRRNSGHIYRYGFAAAAVVLAVVSLRIAPEISEMPQGTVVPDAVITEKHTIVEQKMQLEEGAGNAPKAARKTDYDKQPKALSGIKEQAQDTDEITLPKTDKGSRSIGELMSQGEALTEDFGYAGPNRVGINEKYIPEGLSLGEESYSDGVYSLKYEGDAKAMSVTCYQDKKLVEDMIDEGGGDLFFEEIGEKEYRAYVIKNDKGFVIEAEGIKKEELELFVDAIE